MTILNYNIRQGFATNSSSSHSIIITTKKLKENISKIDRGFDGNTYYFGWNNFVLASEKYKALYLYSMLFDDNGCPNPLNNDFLKILSQIFPKEILEQPSEIDHQSRLLIPFEYDKEAISIDYLKDLYNFITRSDVVVLGGDDNDDPHPLLKLVNTVDSLDYVKDIPLYDYWNNKSSTVCRKDENSGFWVLFDRNSGFKFRFSFDDCVINKSTYPELVDIKITNFCDKKCAFCYQNSNSKGDHGDLNYIRRVIDLLSEKKVFEVAFGGGEPTLHPDFEKIVVYCANKNIVPNFTTKNLNAITEFKDLIIDYVGAIAVSISSVKELKELLKRMESYELDLRKKIQIQIIDTMFSKSDLLDILKILSKTKMGKIFQLNLLGYKNTGRGGQFNKLYDDVNFFDVYKESGAYLNISIDTLAAQKYKSVLETDEDLCVSKNTYELVEGKHSCYIDAVTKTIAPDSFSDTIRDEFNIENFINFKEIFGKY